MSLPIASVTEQAADLWVTRVPLFQGLTHEQQVEVAHAARPGGHCEVVLPLAKKDIASLLDTTPESLSRQLRGLTDSGVLSQEPESRIVITDVAALTALSTGA